MTRQLFLGHRDDPELPRAIDWQLLRRLWPFVRPYRRGFALSLGILLVSFSIELLGPYLVRKVIDGPVKRALDGESKSIAIAESVELGLLYLAVTGLALFVGYAYALVTARNGQRVIRDLRVRLFDRLMRLSPTFHDANPAGKLTTRLTSDVENLNELISTGVLQSFFDLLKILGITAILFVIDPGLATYVALTTPIVIAISLAFRRWARDSYRQVRSSLARQNAFTAELVDGISTTRAFGREADVLDHFRGLNRSTRRNWNRTVLAFSVFFALVDLALRWTQAGLLLVGAYGVLNGSLTAGVFIQFWLLLAKLAAPIRELGEKYNVLQSAMASAERIFQLLDERPRPDDCGRRVTRPSGAPPELRLTDVGFGYDPDLPVLHEISLVIPPGTTCAIVGPTGAGKTTITALLSRLHDPQRGTIHLDDRPLADYPLESLRQRIAVVPQDVFLFTGSVADNIRLFEPSVSDQQVVAALAAVGALEFVSAWPDGIETLLDQGGTTLSLGERQLLSFARAIVSEPDVLILDEATSNIDSASEAKIQRALAGALMRDRTCVVVAHRLSTVTRADQIVVVDAGRIIERGTHAGLMTKPGGTYCRMVGHAAGR